MSTITIEDVTKRFGDTTAVDGLSLSVDDGEVLGVVGPSGCGKTTTLRTLAGFETPTSGRVLFDDEDVTHVPPEQRNVGLVFQSYALFDTMTVWENVAFGPKMRGVSREERDERVAELLSMLDIAELADRDPTTLSGGQKQRVGLARALAIEPRVLLLDEPMTGLDATLKTRLQSEIGGLLDDLGITAVYVTHDQEEAMAMCDRIAVMNDGVLEQHGTPAELYERPANNFVAAFVGTSNRLTATVDDGRLDLGYAALPAPDGVGGDVSLVARPSAFEVGDGPIDATVRERVYLGDHVRTIAGLPDGQEITLRLDPDIGVEPGETVSLSVDVERTHLLEGGA